MSQAEIIHKKFLTRVAQCDFPAPLCSGQENTLSKAELVDLFESQVSSRLLDIISRRLSLRKESFYTIGSSGHEGNAVFGKVFRTTDIAFLHYRSCALLIQRAKQKPGETLLYDILLSFVASAEDPVSGGRHKVFGSKTLWIPPQTSTIASHLPKAMGTAHGFGLLGKVPHNELGLPADSLVICSFGDASLNHSTAQGAINSAAWAAYQHSPMPIVFICEDNGVGISTATPANWIEENFKSRPGLKYIACNGLDVHDTFIAARKAEDYVRKHRRPVFLHCKVIRLMGHAGSDAEAGYRSREQIAQIEAQDPLLHTARKITEGDFLSPKEIVDLYTSMEARINAITKEAIQRPKLVSARQVMDSIWPPKSTTPLPPLVDEAERNRLFADDQRHFNKPIHMAKHINLALADIMLQFPNTILCGEDIAKKGGVYGLTQQLFKKFSSARVINTLLDEQSILGLAIGLAHSGFLPIPEIQYLAYIHNAEDQIRGEAATLSFFSKGQFTNPMVIRIAGLAYQKGFGGHFHNDNSFTVFRDIPGIIVACPSNGHDAALMLRTCIKLAHQEQKIVIFLEPIALYMAKDLHESGDNLWASPYIPPSSPISIDYQEVGVNGQGKDLCILAYANGFYLSRKAHKEILRHRDCDIRIVDLRWLHPLPESAILESISHSENILIVDECRRSGSLSEAIVTLLKEHNCPQAISRVNAEDSFIPLGNAAYQVLPDVDKIVKAALGLLNG